MERRIIYLCIALVGSVAQAATPKATATPEAPPKVFMARVSHGGASALQSLLENGARLVTAPADANFKISMAFDPPVHVAKVIVESCESDFRDGVDFAVAPGLFRAYAESGTKSVTAKFGSEIEVRSLAISFRHNQGVCLKSLRFFDGAEKPIRVSVVPLRDSDLPRERLKREFGQAGGGLPEVLDQSLIARNEDENWIFRFRGDGTYFMYGRSEDVKTPGRFVSLGEFRVVGSGTKNKVKLALKGQRWKAAQPWDGWYCGSICGEREPASPSKVEESLMIEILPGGTYMVRNRSVPTTRDLPFSDASVRISTLQD